MVGVCGFIGVAHCKILAKLASGMHKPSQQTLVSRSAVPGLLHDLPIGRLRQLGGKFGEEVMAQLRITTVGKFTSLVLSLPAVTRESFFPRDHRGRDPSSDCSSDFESSSVKPCWRQHLPDVESAVEKSSFQSPQRSGWLLHRRACCHAKVDAGGPLWGIARPVAA